MRLSDYTVELKFIRDEILEVGITKSPEEAEEMAKEWLSSIDDPLGV